MEAKLNWLEGMSFQAECAGHGVKLDAKSPIGKGGALTPKELVAIGLAGCTAMDVVALLKKHKQTFTDFNMSVDVESTTGVQPAVFTKAVLKYSLAGPVDAKILLESVNLSQTKYCGVSAMLAKAFPISYQVFLDEKLIGEGNSHF